MKLSVEALIEAIFSRDYVENSKYSHISQIGVVTIKSLIPSKEDLGIRIDYKRFDEEIRLWNGYKTSEDTLIGNYVYEDMGRYYTEDVTSYFRTVILATVNKDIDILEDEIIKSTLYSSGSIESLFKNLILGYKIYYLLSSYNSDTIIENIKNHIICFSQKDYMDRYEKDYRFDLKDYKNYKLEFEKAKIDLISLLNGIKKDSLRGVYEYLYLEDLTEEVLSDLYSKGLGDWLMCSEVVELPKFYSDLSVYVESLRRGRIEPESLYIGEYILPDVFGYEVGEEFYHSLLKKAKIVKRETMNGQEFCFVQTKTGVYVFRK